MEFEKPEEAAAAIQQLDRSEVRFAARCIAYMMGLQKGILCSCDDLMDAQEMPWQDEPTRRLAYVQHMHKDITNVHACLYTCNMLLL